MTTVDRPGVVALRPVDPDLFRSLLCRRAATVTVVTTPGLAGGRRLPSLPPAGVAATSFTPVSLDPPLVSFRLGRESASWPAVARAEHVAMHLLSSGSQPFITGETTYADQRGWTSGPFGLPLIDDALAVLLCRVVRRIEADDQTVVFGEPLALGVGGPVR